MSDVAPLAPEFYREHWGAMPPPKFSTRRDFTAPTLGERQGKFGRIWLGQPFMPFQQYVADVTGELRLNDAGFWVPRYTKCVITLQRQGGKSHMSMARNAERCFSVPKWKSFYTAQTGQDARDEFLKFYDDRIAGEVPLDDVVQVKRGRGDEQMVFPNGSIIKPVPPTEEKMHGKQSDSTDVDEGWAFSKEEGEALVTAGAPTKLTRTNRGSQTFIWSAGGTPESTWLAELVAQGRAGDDSICFIEFGIPDDSDAEDLDNIAAYHPAFGHTVTKDGLIVMRADFGSDAAGWARAAGNRWTEVIGGMFSADAWSSVREPDPIPDHVPLGYGAARAADGSEVVIAAAGRVGDVVVVEILDVLPTAFGAAEHVKGWATDGPVAVDMTGPSKTIGDSLAGDNGFPDERLLKLSVGDMTAACANVVDALKPRAYRYRQHPSLDAAVSVAGKRTVGDGGFVWARVAAGASIAALEAATLAVWALDHRPASGKPEIHFAA